MVSTDSKMKSKREQMTSKRSPPPPCLMVNPPLQADPKSWPLLLAFPILVLDHFILDGNQMTKTPKKPCSLLYPPIALMKKSALKKVKTRVSHRCGSSALKGVEELIRRQRVKVGGFHKSPKGGGVDAKK